MQEGGDPSDACFNSKLNKNPGLIARAVSNFTAKVARVGVVGIIEPQVLQPEPVIALPGLRYDRRHR